MNAAEAEEFLEKNRSRAVLDREGDPWTFHQGPLDPIWEPYTVQSLLNECEEYVAPFGEPEGRKDDAGMNADEATEWVCGAADRMVTDRCGETWNANPGGLAMFHLSGGRDDLLPGGEPYTKGHCLNQSAEPEGRKDDAGKPRWSLVPLEVVREVEAEWRSGDAPTGAEAREFAWEVVFEYGNRDAGLVTAIAGLVDLLGPNARHAAWAEVARVFEHGAGKYGDENYLTVEPDRYIDAAFRHLFLASGPDDESGIDHVAHAIASLVIYRQLTKESK